MNCRNEITYIRFKLIRTNDEKFIGSHKYSILNSFRGIIIIIMYYKKIKH